MFIIPLQNDAPNQHFSMTVDTDYYDITLRTSSNVTLMTLARNGVQIVQSKRCPPLQFLLQKWQENGRGNFAFQNANQDYPYYEDFGVVTFLVYYSPDEMKAVRK